jgi:hypothetical protein
MKPYKYDEYYCYVDWIVKHKMCVSPCVRVFIPFVLRVITISQLADDDFHINQYNEKRLQPAQAYNYVSSFNLPVLAGGSSVSLILLSQSSTNTQSRASYHSAIDIRNGDRRGRGYTSGRYGEHSARAA